MPKSMGQDEVKAILESGDFSQLIGSIEDERLEFKSAPYNLENDYQKQELAKDVSAFANAKGGLILIGVKTERNPSHFGDELTEIHTFTQNLINTTSYQDILQSWIYPSLREVEIQWFPSADNQHRGIGAIIIPEQPSTKWPFLVTKTVDNRGKHVGVVFGYVERRRANAVPISVQELQTLIRDGRRNELLNKQLENIQEMLRSERALDKISSNSKISELLNNRIEQALIGVALQHNPSFILAAIPIDPIEIPALFTARNAAIVQLIEQPPELRRTGSGFDLNTGAPAPILRGELRRSVTPGYKILDLWKDGTLIFVAEGNGEFLSWGRYYAKGGALRVNQLGLLEATYLFAELSRQVFDQAQSKPRQIEYHLELRNMTVDGKPCGLIPGPLDRFGGQNIHFAPESEAVFTVRWENPQINPGLVSFLIVSKVYEWFGIEHEHIPYTERMDDHFVISPDQIRRAAQTH